MYIRAGRTAFALPCVGVYKIWKSGLSNKIKQIFYYANTTLRMHHMYTDKT